MDTSEAIHSCPHCSKIFKKTAALLSHVKWMHEERCRNQCDRCGKIFHKKHYLTRHLESGIHDGDRIESTRCSMCDFCGVGRKTVLIHYQEYHKIVLEQKMLCFKTTEEFRLWKTNFERETKSRFVKTTRTRVSKDGSRRCSFVCHRDGNFKPKGNNIRPLKLQGSNKINSHCPARIDVNETDECIKVNCIETHIGHELDISRLTVSKAEKVLMTHQKGRVSKKLQDVKVRHEASLSLSEHYVVELENSWTVGSPQNKDIYTVEKNNPDCKCQLCCTECEACLHSYKCSCIDSFVKGNMCKHIHLVCMFIISKESDVSDAISNVSSVEISMVHDEQLAICSEINNQCDRSWGERKKEALDKVQSIYNMIENEEQLHVFLEQISPLENILRNLSNKGNTLEKLCHPEYDKVIKIENMCFRNNLIEVKSYCVNNPCGNDKAS